MIKNNHIKLLLSLGVGVAILFAYTAIYRPDSENFLSIFIVLLLIYLISGVTIILLLRVLKPGYKNTVPLGMLLATIPPATILLISLRQATIFDIGVIVFTIGLILWYLTYKK